MLRSFAEGGTQDEIARREHVSINTVKYYAKRLPERLGVLDIKVVVFIATAAGILTATLPPELTGITEIDLDAFRRF